MRSVGFAARITGAIDGAYEDHECPTHRVLSALGHDR
jgi:hypothetical protein